ncbi:hypothetical protein HWV07_01205 [Natronomonas salina]|uniref:hypothetical protein n=1 Tax=Natronomonas salina TaxID=1710540 RepID=UPI0015B4B24F|nr:hypothetical protein [Natronomonas salina]QLD87724.1 hypothetical protein HWV07_01205 [Natronomonas salina]
MRRRTLLKTAPAAASLPLAGCLDPVSSGEDEPSDSYPDDWYHADPIDSEYVAFEAGTFDTTAGNPPEEDATLDGNEAWQLVTETAWALREVSFQLSVESKIVEGQYEGRWRRSLWRNAETGVVYQRQEIERQSEPDATVRDYNDGTRYVATDHGGETEHFHVPDPNRHRDRVDSHLLMSFFQLSEFEIQDTVTVDGAELRHARHTEATSERLEMELATFFTGVDGIVRNAQAQYGTPPGTPTEDRYSIDGGVEITAGTPTIEEPEWTEDALEEEREPFESPA